MKEVTRSSILDYHAQYPHVSYSEIAKVFRVSTEEVQSVCPPRPEDPLVEQVIAAFESEVHDDWPGVNSGTLGRRFNVHHQTVRSILDQHSKVYRKLKKIGVINMGSGPCLAAWRKYKGLKGKRQYLSAMDEWICVGPTSRPNNSVLSVWFDEED